MKVSDLHHRDVIFHPDSDIRWTISEDRKYWVNLKNGKYAPIPYDEIDDGWQLDECSKVKRLMNKYEETDIRG